MDAYVAAIDLGASSGRVLLARHDATQQTLAIEEIHRFANGFIRQDGHDCWDVDELVRQIELGLETILARHIVPDSIGIDTWGVDFVLLDAQGQRLGQAVAYRDHRTDGVMEQVFQKLPQAEVYARTGIQFMQFNTLYQLFALQQENPAWLPRVDRLMLMADYLHYRLCQVKSCEYTNASTTQMINLATGDWDRTLIAALGLPQHWFEKPCQPGTHLGQWQSGNGVRIPVITPATHDTASAVIGSPLAGPDAAYISSGTWSLMGIESPTPCADAAALAANITNEGGIDHTYRVLQNIMGLWLIQRVRDAFPQHSFADLVRLAECAPPLRYLINPNDARFLNPPSMLQAIQAFCQETGQGRPEQAGEVARCVFESLAFLYRQTMEALQQISGRTIARIHIVGGGSQNGFLNQLCADFCQVPVIAGPVEASALGNVTCQLRALGRLPHLAAMRTLVRQSFAVAELPPRRAPAELAQQHWPRFQTLCCPTAPAAHRTTEGAIHE